MKILLHPFSLFIRRTSRLGLRTNARILKGTLDEKRQAEYLQHRRFSTFDQIGEALEPEAKLHSERWNSTKALLGKVCHEIGHRQILKIQDVAAETRERQEEEEEEEEKEEEETKKKEKKNWSETIAAERTASTTPEASFDELLSERDLFRNKLRTSYYFSQHRSWYADTESLLPDGSSSSGGFLAPRSWVSTESPLINSPVTFNSAFAISNDWFALI